MTGILHGTRRAAAALMALAVFAAAIALPGQKTSGWPGRSGHYMQRASVVIKTQEAADSVQGGIRGIDVSKYQGSINWAKVAQDNVSFVMVRASFGMEADEYFEHNARGAHENGLLVGAYHYAKFTDRESMQREAEFFIRQLKKVEITYPVALDLEASRGLSRSRLTELAIEFMELLRAAGYTPMLYSYTNFYRDYLSVSALSGYDLWVANYLQQPNTFAHKMWQHTSYGTVSGINGRVDINIAYEDLRVRKSIKVDKTVSDSIKQTLNSRYGASLPMDKLDMELMNAAVSKGMHTEINQQLGAGLDTDLPCDDETIDWLSSISFVPYETKGNITYLLQVRLFYKGLYKGELTSQYDDGMIEAVKTFQSNNSLSADGMLDYDTLWYLLT